MTLSSVILAALVPYGPTVAEAPPTSPAPSPTPTVSAPVQDEEEGPDGKWHGFVEAGGTYTDGNTDVRTFSVATESIKEINDERFTIRSYWNYARNDGDITDRNAGASAKWDHFVTEKFYYNTFAAVETDSEADLDLRYILGAGVGYQFRDDEKVKFGGEAGLSYFNEKLDPGDDSDYIAARLAYSLDYTVSETTLFQQRTNVFPSLEDKEDFYGKVDSKLSFEIKENWAAFIQHILDYDNTPADDADRLDHRVVVGLRWSY